MLNARTVFSANIRDADALTALYDYLHQTISTPLPIDDLLRSKLVYAVSAFDKLIHDLILVGMVDIYNGTRLPTPKYLAEPISLEVAQLLVSTTNPPPVAIFEREIQQKLKKLSFQEPEKVSDGLGYIWDEKQKWQRIAAGIRMSDQDAKATLKQIVARRNAIVHEADLDPVTHMKRTITKAECEGAAKFVLDVGHQICLLVGYP